MTHSPHDRPGSYTEFTYWPLWSFGYWSPFLAHSLSTVFITSLPSCFAWIMSVKWCGTYLWLTRSATQGRKKLHLILPVYQSRAFYSLCYSMCTFKSVGHCTRGMYSHPSCLGLGSWHDLNPADHSVICGQYLDRPLRSVQIGFRIMVDSKNFLPFFATM